MMGQPDF